jgi:transcriptional regulator with XRE-family HTH domain
MTKPTSKKRNFPKALKEWRKGRGFTQQQAAKVIGVKLATYRNWEQGRNRPIEALVNFLFHK